VTREMVCDHIGYSKDKNWQTDFIKRVVEPNLEDRQYQQIPADHPLVTAYFHSSELRNGETPQKAGNRRKYYMITGIRLNRCAVLRFSTLFFYSKIETKTQITNMSLVDYAERHGITGEELEFLRRYGTTDFNRSWF
jgi:hypothetical protein